jgi:hypothetical protein
VPTPQEGKDDPSFLIVAVFLLSNPRPKLTIVRMGELEIFWVGGRE